MTGFLIEDDAYRGRLDFALWRRIVAHARPYRRQLIGLGLSGLVIAGIDVGFPLVTRLMIDEAMTGGMTPRLLAGGAAYGALVIALSAGVWYFILLAGQVATGVACDLRCAGFARLQELSFSYFDVRPVGWLVSRLTSDCSKLSSLIPWFALDLVWGSCLIVGIAITMAFLDWRLALAVMVIVPLLAGASVYFQQKLLVSSRMMRKINSQMTASFHECIAGVRTTKTLVREAENLREFGTLSGEMWSHSIRNALQSAVYLPLVVTLGSVGVALALWRGGMQLPGTGLTSAADDGLTIGTLVAFMQYAAFLYMPIQEMARRFTEVQSAQAAAERIQSLLDAEPEIVDGPEVRRAIAARAGVDAAAGAEAGVAVDGQAERIEEIEFRNVSFAYQEGEPVLTDFDLTVRAGQTVALVGATGGGKSTIVSLVARFYEPTRGSILVDGVDYRRRSLHWLQSNLGVVLQTPHLFSGSIRENIRYGRLDATDDEVESAARLVNAHAFVTALEHGYESEVGEGGGLLSTGQRQLVSLARAVLADPQIFIMDEATSSLDTETERLIQDAISTVLAGRIAFVIAHRLSTIRSADVILVIRGGRIVESGTHRELLARGRAYHALYVRHLAREG